MDQNQNRGVRNGKRKKELCMVSPEFPDIKVDSYETEHNEMNYFMWKRYLTPATQCGHENTYKGTYWQTRLYKRDLCEPIGHKGGN